VSACEDRRAAVKLWVVVGGTGEYSDRFEWFVCAYWDESTAQAHADEAMLAARDIQAQFGRYETHGARFDALAAANPWDPRLRMDYTGTDYHVDDVEVRDTLLAALDAHRKGAK
jgi:hypothetical protein